MPHEGGGGHKTYFQGAIGFLLGDEGSNLNRPVPREVGEKHINDLLGRHPFHPYDPSIDDSIPDLTGVKGESLTPAITEGGKEDDTVDNATTQQTLAAMDKKFIDHAWACLRRKEKEAGAGSGVAEGGDGAGAAVDASATAGAGSYLNLPYLTHPQDHPCYSQNKLFGMCMRDEEKSEMELFMKHVNCFHPYKVDLMKCITKYTRTDRLKKQQQQQQQLEDEESKQ